MTFNSSDTSLAEGLVVGSVCQQLDIKVITVFGSLGIGPGRNPPVTADITLNGLFISSFLFENGFMHVRTSKNEIPKL